jgi:hypothetical protein
VIDEVTTSHTKQKPVPNVSEPIRQLVAIWLKAKS